MLDFCLSMLILSPSNLDGEPQVSEVEPTAREKLPAIVVASASLLAEANLQIQGLLKALAHLGCSCTCKTREVSLEAHFAFCKYRCKVEDLGLQEIAQ